MAENGGPQPAKLTYNDFQDDMNGYVQDLKNEIGTLKQVPSKNVQAITAAGQNAEKGLEAIINGSQLLSTGDKIGGARALLEGVGQLSNVAALCGPLGAAAGALLSIITGIISAIMGLLNPEKESLEAKIEKIIKEESLTNEGINLQASEDNWITDGEQAIKKLAFTRQTISQTLDAGQTFDKDKDITSAMYLPEGYTPEMLKQGIAWERLTAMTEVKQRTQEIYDALEYLKNNTALASEVWGALMDQTVGYMFRLWVSVIGLAGLVDNVGHGMFQDWRKELASQFKKDLDALAFDAQNKCQLYHRWHTASYDYYTASNEYLYKRVGLTGSDHAASDQVGDYAVANFAVASSGTIFSATDYATPRAGRPGTGWLAATGNQECEQIFIGELPSLPDLVIVFCTHGGGRQLSRCNFNDALGVGELSPKEWTPNAHRWGGWTHSAYSFQIASIAIAPRQNETYDIYAIGLNDDLSASLYQLSSTAAQVVEGFHWTQDEVKSANAPNLLSGSGWSAYLPYSCAISTAPFLAVQLGNKVKFKDGTGKMGDWELSSFFQVDYGQEQLSTRYGKFYSDGTFVTCHNYGLHMRYWSPQEGQYLWAKEAGMESAMVQKIPLHNGALYWVLSSELAA